MKPHLTHLFLEVGDLDRARWFWVEVMGLALLDDRGDYIAVGGNGGFSLGIEQAATPPTIAGCPELTLRVADVDEFTDGLRERGISVAEESADMPWGARHAWLSDPDGRRMSVYSADHTIMDRE